jgi:hypothetical protein
VYDGLEVRRLGAASNFNAWWPRSGERPIISHFGIFVFCYHALYGARITYTLATKVGDGSRDWLAASECWFWSYRERTSKTGARLLVISMCHVSN